MEQEPARRRPHPRTANDRSRLIVTTLLLLGGAFVLGLTWTVRYYHLFTDRLSPYVPASAEMMVMLPLDEGAASLSAAFDGDFGEVLSSIRFARGKSLVVFVDRDVDNGNPVWHVMTDAEIDVDALPPGLSMSSFRHLHIVSSGEARIEFHEKRPRGKFRMMPRSEGRGFISLGLIGEAESNTDGSKVPLRISAQDNGLRLQIGRRLRGFASSKEFPVNARQVTFLPSFINAYAIIPPGTPSFDIENYHLRSSISEIVRNSGMTAEIMLSEAGDYAVLLHQYGRATARIEVIEQPIIDELSVLEPIERRKWLPDGTLMTELILNTGAVSLEERRLAHDIILKTYASEDDRSISLILYPDGRIWITNKPEFAASLLVVDAGIHGSEEDCQPNTVQPGVIFSGSYIQDIPMLDSSPATFISDFRANSLRVDSVETGLFTFCGYF